MVDNFEAVKRFMSFDKEGDFYFIQLIKRRKDIPELSKGEKPVRDYFVYSFEQLDSLKEDIVNLCQKEKARAYIRVNKRNDEIIALETLYLVSSMIRHKLYNNVRKAYLNACGRVHSEPSKMWIVDIDSNSPELISSIRTCIESMYHKSNVKDYKIITEINTVNGMHIISNPFNLQEFKSRFPEVDIHKDNPSLLYYYG